MLNNAHVSRVERDRGDLCHSSAPCGTDRMVAHPPLGGERAG
jgi:hypothetical protein